MSRQPLFTRETPGTAPEAPPEPPRAPLWHRIVAGTLKTVLPLAILAAGAFLARDLYLSAPVATPAAPERIARLVTVATVSAAPDARPVIEAWGPVAPARMLYLSTEVSGRVVRLHPELTPGGIIDRGATLVALDDREARLAVAQAEAEIRQIEAQIAIEAGQAARAMRDLERLPDRELTDAQRALVLREPQMAELEARLAAAEAQREAAEVALSKTVIEAPFDVLVEAEEVALGARLAPSATFATLMSAAAFRVTLAVPPSALDWIDPRGGQTVRLTQPGVWPEGAFREGRIRRLEPGLSAEGRMAELVVEVEDPLARETDGPPLLVGSFLKAEIEGRPVAGAVSLDRALLRDGDTAWVMTGDGTLEIRALEIAWRGADAVLVTAGLAPGERVVATPLATVADGMALRIAGE